MRPARVLATLWRFIILSIRSWKTVSIFVVIVFAICVAETLVRRHLAMLKLSRLLEHEFSETPTRHHIIDIGRRERKGDAIHENVTSGIHYFSPSKCPRSIASLPIYSQWFRERFNPNIKMFLEENDLTKWNNLSFYELPYGFKKENYTLMSNILRHRDFRNPSLNLKNEDGDCISCAVVGSGGILNGSHVGRQIDSHDFVFRLNNAATYGKHADSVGQKINFYIFFPESAHLSHLKDKNVTLLYAMYNSFDINYAAEIFGLGRRKRRIKADPRKVKIIHPDFFRYVFAKYLGGKSMKPTTGSIAVLLAMHLCDSVTIYGFGYDPRYTMQYYDTRFTRRTYKSTWTHDVENEKRLWDKLHDEGAIRFLRGTRDKVEFLSKYLRVLSFGFRS